MEQHDQTRSREHPRFDRSSLRSLNDFSVIGSGELGGKATGLALALKMIDERFPRESFPGISVGIPRLTVLATDAFDSFMLANSLYPLALSDAPDDRIAHAFQKGELPVEIVGDLWGLIRNVTTPLAVRSSSLLEDARKEPFAGIYATKMTPNNQPDVAARFQRLVEAIKFVYASTFFSAAKEYMAACGHKPQEEKMAVVIQDVIGNRHSETFYPEISGVARSFNYYPYGAAKPEEGVASLALGLGKSIVDGYPVWTYSPAHPRASMPYSSLRDLANMTQSRFWAVNMGKTPEYDPTRETEYMIQLGLEAAEYDDTLGLAASTWDHASDRLRMGISEPGPRVLNFAPVLDAQVLPVNPLIRELLKLCEDTLGEEVEMEFALSIPPAHTQAQFGFLQVRPMVVSRETVEISDEDLHGVGTIISSKNVLGNGSIDSLEHMVYVKPETFDPKHSKAVAEQVAAVNRRLLSLRIPYLLIGFGRWGSSDPWLGIPVTWGQVAGAKVIVEVGSKTLDVELSQGSHFFHNISSFSVSYFCLNRHSDRMDWSWLASLPAESETEFVRVVRTPSPLVVKVDGRSGRGMVRR